MKMPGESGETACAPWKAVGDDYARMCVLEQLPRHTPARVVALCPLLVAVTHPRAALNACEAFHKHSRRR